MKEKYRNKREIQVDHKTFKGIDCDFYIFFEIPRKQQEVEDNFSFIDCYFMVRNEFIFFSSSSSTTFPHS